MFQFSGYCYLGHTVYLFVFSRLSSVNYVQPGKHVNYAINKDFSFDFLYFPSMLFENASGINQGSKRCKL